MDKSSLTNLLAKTLQPLVEDGVVTHIYTPITCICEDEDVRDIACEAHKPPPATYTFFEDVP